MSTETSSLYPTSYWPLFRASLWCTILAVAIKAGSIAAASVISGTPIQLGRKFYIVPALTVLAKDWETFRGIITSSTIVTGIALALFTIGTTVLNRQHFQVQAGRSFAWAHIAVMGLTDQIRGWLDAPLMSTRTNSYLILFGAVGFGVSVWLIYDRFRESNDLI